MQDGQQKFIDTVTRIVYTVLENENLLRGNMRNGKVESVLSDYRLSVFVDGSIIPCIVPCNPDVVFSVGDEIFVQYINGDSKNRFAVCKRATGTESVYKPI